METHHEIAALYREFTMEPPLDVAAASWDGARNARLTLPEFARLLARIVEAGSLKALPLLGFDMDFDNVAPAIKVLHRRGNLRFVGGSNYVVSGLPERNRVNTVRLDGKLLDSPKADTNQFPCSSVSRTRRLERLVADFPYATKLSVGFFGDDDLTSIALAAATPFEPVVFEIDEDVISRITLGQAEWGLCFQIFKNDLRVDAVPERIVDTFIIDPPYTVYGALCFLRAGFRALRESEQCYLLLNRMLLGRENLGIVLGALANAGVVPMEILPAFNNYPLPPHYREARDLGEHMRSLGCSTLEGVHSSASSLFVLSPCRTQSDGLWNRLAGTGNIYRHRDGL